MLRRYSQDIRLCSLMGGSAYGRSGLNPVVSAHLWKLYTLLCPVYGLEVQFYSSQVEQELDLH